MYGDELSGNRDKDDLPKSQEEIEEFGPWAVIDICGDIPYWKLQKQRRQKLFEPERI